jgi:hypothetical protein
MVIGKGIDLSSPFSSWPQGSATGTSFDWMYQYIFNACGATMFSILAFFIASAAYRTFRAKSREATILLIAAIIIMIGVPIGSLISEAVPGIVNWIMEVPNTAAQRGILLGICLGSIATSLRIIFGIERGYLGGGE